ncbi:MAG: hypothetical protein IKO85_03005 [Bacteroidaceae bacterium]|nr:hypothetical protein [Bacteroidaceae bacterium]
MKKKICLLLTLLSILFSSCHQDNPQYEYKILQLKSAIDEHMTEDFQPSKFDDPTRTLNRMASEGWTLDHVYTVVGTTYPNLSTDKMHVGGIRSNTKTHCVYFIFKRRRIAGTKEVQEMETINEYSIPFTVTE